MSTIILGCDANGVNDKECRDTVAKLLKKAGHTVEKLPIGPGQFANASYSKKNKGKIGVFLIAAGTFSIADFYYGKTHFKYAYFGIRGDIPSQKAGREPGFSTLKIGKDPDCTSVCSKIAGMTFKQMNEKLKDRVHIVGGSTAKEIGNNLVQALGGNTSDTNSSSKKESSGGSIKDALKKAVSGWDGDVEIRIVEDTVYVNKIKDPTTSKLEITEYDNALYDNITVTDVNPSTVNYVTLKYGKYELTLQDEFLVKRFGKIKKTLKADKTVKDLKSAKSFLNREWNKIRRDDGRQIEIKVTGSLKWKTGLWVRVFLPSYFIDDYMYIIKVSHDEDNSGNWVTSLTLRDYPPSFGTEEGGS